MLQSDRLRGLAGVPREDLAEVVVSLHGPLATDVRQSEQGSILGHAAIVVGSEFRNVVADSPPATSCFGAAGEEWVVPGEDAIVCSGSPSAPLARFAIARSSKIG